jgi:amidase/aspartyl-tRNA(Asn)/glutamyl-tRNA(Gln) amidotransferase subunit A
MVPLALASDTNGSIRVPASFCGVFGLKPTLGRLPRTGSALFAASLDHLGPLAANVADLATAYDLLQGPDPHDGACAQRVIEPTLAALDDGLQGLRVGRLAGYFDRHATAEAQNASVRVATALGALGDVDLPDVEVARAAAFVLTAAEGGALHLETLRDRYADFEPLSRDRFLAGALTPAAWYLKAQRVRAWFRNRMREVFAKYDLLIAPATPCSATPAGAEWLDLGGERWPLRPSLGLLTQPISFVGLPVVAAPVTGAGSLPIGVQLIAAPWREDVCLRAAAALERAGVARAVVLTKAG